MWNKLKLELKNSTLELVALNVSLIDSIWTEGRTPKRSKDAFILGVEYAGNYSKFLRLIHTVNGQIQTISTYTSYKV